MKIANRKNRNRLISAAIVVIFIVLAMTPLVPEAEVSSCLVVTALGIDSEDGVIKLTAETSDGTATESVHGEGIRVTDAMQDLVLKNDTAYPIYVHAVVRDNALRDRVEKLIRADKVFDPQRYARDRGPRRMIDVLMTEMNQVRKFKRYYPEPTDTSF